jgi:hypothetical protein
MKTSVMLESYWADIERLLREGTLRPALRLSAALPDICAALEHARMQSSRERYVAWCKTWLRSPAGFSAKAEPGERLFHLHDGQTAAALRRLRMSRRARRERALARPRVGHPVNRLQAFQVELIEALVDAGRRWYREQGAHNALVQRNLGRLLVSG